MPTNSVRRAVVDRSDISNRSTDIYTIGYNIYRNNELVDFVHHMHSHYSDVDLGTGVYEYYLTTLYELLDQDGIIESAATEMISLIVDPVSVDDELTAPFVTGMVGNYPNPFNPETAIIFSLSERSNVRIDVYNVLGQKVTTLLNEEKELGQHRVVWSGKGDTGKTVGSGVYFYKMTTGKYTQTKKIMLIR